MDGTFLKSDGKTYDKDRLRKVLEVCQDKGILFVPASGRQLLALKQLFAEFTDQIAFVAENGAIVEYKDQIIYENKMTPDEYIQIADILADNPKVNLDSLALSGRNGSYLLDTVSQDSLNHIKKYYSNVQTVKNFSEVDDEIFKLTVNFPHDYVLEGEKWLNERVKDYRGVTTGFESIDIIASHVNKGTALKVLGEKFHIKPSEMAAFGDNLNDYEMLSYVEHSYATANARDAIKDISKTLIGHHDDEATIAEIEKLIQL